MELSREQITALIGLVTEYITEADRAHSPLAQEFLVTSGPVEYRVNMWEILHLLIAAQSAERFYAPR